MQPLHLLAFDFGATSGRSMLGILKDSKLSLREISRFPNASLTVRGKQYWDIFRLFEEVKRGITLCVKEGIAPDAIGIDTWGVDFVLLDEEGDILSLPRAYRDPYTLGVPARFFERMPAEEVYAQTGIQFMDFNTLFQLFALAAEKPTLLKSARTLLFMPDALSYLLTGRKVCEETIASTSQLFHPQTKQVLPSLLHILGLTADVFPERVQPATPVGVLTDAVCRETGAGHIPVIAVAGHDTASAVAAVPAQNERFAYLSSGTWSLMGIEVKEPVITPDSFRLNFTNEGGVEGSIRLLKNIPGMWMLEECRREWERAGKAYTYADLCAAVGASSFGSVLDPNDPSFAHPVSMTAAIAAYCRSTQQAVPASPADTARCLFVSLAQCYKQTLANLQSLAPFPIERLHIIGGGSQNALLNRLTAEAIGLPVLPGPVEATAIGNILLQAKALGAGRSLAEMRLIVNSE